MKTTAKKDWEQHDVFFLFLFVCLTYSLGLDTLGDGASLGVDADRARAENETVGNNSLGYKRG